jgi:hypothetical protein
MRRSFPIFPLVILALALALAPTLRAQPASAAVATVLDRFHTAAAKADFAGYFALFAPEGVFLGTDAAERWTVSEFKAFAKPYFDRGRGWTYTVKTRHVFFSPDGTHAIFDEHLDNASYGACRGSGVLRRSGDEWRIVQYHLTIPIPNDLAGPVVKLIRAAKRP